MTYKYLDKQDLNRENLINDEQFLEDAALFLEDRGGYEFSYSDEDVNEQIYDGFMEHFRKQNVNEVTATRDLFYAQTANDEQQERFGNLMNAYDNMDSDFGWKAAGDYAEGVFKAPSTYAGIFSFGAAKAGSLAAQQGIKLGIRQALKRKAKSRLRAGLESSVDGFKKTIYIVNLIVFQEQNKNCRSRRDISFPLVIGFGRPMVSRYGHFRFCKMSYI